MAPRFRGTGVGEALPAAAPQHVSESSPSGRRSNDAHGFWDDFHSAESLPRGVN